jgi:hypothetical protein
VYICKVCLRPHCCCCIALPTYIKRSLKSDTVLRDRVRFRNLSGYNVDTAFFLTLCLTLEQKQRSHKKHLRKCFFFTNVTCLIYDILAKM